MASVDIIKLGWEDYPQPKIISRQGVFYVKINIPVRSDICLELEKVLALIEKSQLVQPILPLQIKKMVNNP